MVWQDEGIGLGVESVQETGCYACSSIRVQVTPVGVEVCFIFVGTVFNICVKWS